MSIVTSLSQWRLFRKSTEGIQGERTGTNNSHLKCFQFLKNQYSSDKTGRSQAKVHLIYNLHVQLLFRLKGIIIWRKFVHRAQWRVEFRFPSFLLSLFSLLCLLFSFPGPENESSISWMLLNLALSYTVRHQRHSLNGRSRQVKVILLVGS